MDTILTLIKTITSIFEQIMGIFAIFSKKKETEEHKKEVVVVQQEEKKVAAEVKSGDIDNLNKDLGWKP
jgi:cell fate (sporulation/competence/biofilm development) regulator YmcA (YheA/YmcA/DUF963 family)